MMEQEQTQQIKPVQQATSEPNSQAGTTQPVDGQQVAGEFHKKWWFWVIIGLVILGLGWLIFSLVF